MKYISLLVLAILSVSYSYAQRVDVTIKGIRSGKGQVFIVVFTDEDGFKNNKDLKRVRYAKKDIKNGTLQLSIDLAPGTYGLSLLDDENSNKKMDYNMIGIPKEGYAFSDFYHTGFTRPKFEDFKFTLKAGETKTVEMKVRYL